MSAKATSFVDAHLERLGFRTIDLPDDVRARVFRLLSREEEFETTTLHSGQNWEPTQASLERLDEMRIPVIEASLGEWVERGWIAQDSAPAHRWPDGRRFALCLTHDIDNVQEYPWRERLRAFPSTLRQARTRDWVAHALSTASHAAVRLRAGVKPRPSPPLDAWMAAEESHGFFSSYLFMADELPGPDWKDGFYTYDDRVDFEGGRHTVGEVIRIISERGWDVGLHAGMAAHADADRLAAERATVEKASGVPVTSIRQHHLMYDVRVTPRVHASAGFLADSSLGSNHQTAFRCGTGLPFYLYDLEADERLPVLEIPLIVQDVALIRGVGGDEDLAVRHCAELFDRVAQHHGAITLLWHNDHHPGSAAFRIYERVLAEAATRGAWGCSMRQLEQWWRAPGDPVGH